jgi:hypothetical protein
VGHKYNDECGCDECEAEFRRVLLENLIDDEPEEKEE